MANLMQSPPEPNLSGLVQDIINDAQELLKQQAELIRSEIRDDMRKSKEALLYLAIGAGVALPGLLLLGLTAVHVLHAFAPGLQLWACYAIVTGVVCVASAALIVAGVRKFQSFNPLPDQSVAGLQENLQWQTNPR